MKLPKGLHRGLNLYFSPYEQDQSDGKRADAALKELLKLPDDVQLVLNKPTGPDVIEGNIRAIIDDTISGVLALQVEGGPLLPLSSGLIVNFRDNVIKTTYNGVINGPTFKITDNVPEVELEEWLKETVKIIYRTIYEFPLIPCDDFPVKTLKILLADNLPDSAEIELGNVLRNMSPDDQKRIAVQKMLRQVIFIKEDGEELVLEISSCAFILDFAKTIKIQGKLGQSNVSLIIIHPQSLNNRQILVTISQSDGAQKEFNYEWNKQ